MAVTSGKQYGVGMRYVKIYQLNSNGSPNATSATRYDGLQIAGARAFELTLPDARVINHVGDDILLAKDTLPQQEGATGVLRAARNDYDVYALITSTTSRSLNEIKQIGWSTNEQGNEPHVGLLCYQQSLDATTKRRRWRSYIIPKAQLIIKPTSLDENPGEYEYQIIPTPVTAPLWEETFTDGTDGFTNAEFLEMMTDDKLEIVSFLGDASTTVFAFASDKQATSTDKITVYEDGVETTSGITKTTADVTWTSAPASNVRITILYEWS